MTKDTQAIDTRLVWVMCEACGGSGEIVRRDPSAHDPSDEYSELCSACEGTGRDCVESPIADAIAEAPTERGVKP